MSSEQCLLKLTIREWHQKIEGQSSELNMRKLLYTKVGYQRPVGG